MNKSVCDDISMPLHESETCELKRSSAELEEALKSMVAILNKHQQGELYFGIKDNGEVIGQDVSDKTLRDIAQLANQKIEPRIFPEINQVRLEDKDCIRIEFHGLQAPYFYDGRGYLR
ncbi:MAG: ATP-binding protein, partial [Candidatus Micrarchaeota archaeon]